MDKVKRYFIAMFFKGEKAFSHKGFAVIEDNDKNPLSAVPERLKKEFKAKAPEVLGTNKFDLLLYEVWEDFESEDDFIKQATETDFLTKPGVLVTTWL